MMKQNGIIDGIKMTPRVMEVVTKAINEVNLKVLAETREDALAEGESKASERIAKSLRDKVDINDLSQATGLTVDEIKRL